jgi:hypothetical protein
MGNTEFNQLLQVPNLLIHYYHHQQNGDQIPFPAFVAEHYGKGDNITTDNQEEQQLPFMQVHSHAFSIAILPVIDPVTKVPTALPRRKISLKDISHKLPVGFFGTLLKPPRFIS